MNKLDVFIKRLREAGIDEEQIYKAVFALDEYNNARFAEQYAQQGSKEASE